MKNNITLYTGLVAMAILTSCTGGQKSAKEENATATEASDATAVTYAINNETSTVTWKGEVAGVYGHTGLIAIKEGQITAKGDQLTGGTVIIDMTTIQPTDSASYSEEHPASDLVAHLSTDDFFLVGEFPTASFVIKSQSGSDLIGELTIKGITKEVTAKLNTLEASSEGLKGSAELVFNRQDFKVSWVHYMQDMVLSDDITINLEIVAKS